MEKEIEVASEWLTGYSGLQWENPSYAFKCSKIQEMSNLTHILCLKRELLQCSDEAIKKLNELKS